MRKTFIAAMVATIAMPSAGQAETLEFTAGGLGGGWYTMAAGISSLVHEKDASVTIKTVTGGGVSNPSKINSGKSQLGMVQSIFAVAAVNGTTPFNGKKHGKLRLVADGLAINYLHMVRANGDKTDFKGIFTNGRNKIGVAKAGSTDEYSFRFAMDYYKTSYDALRKSGKIFNAGYTDLASAFKDNQIDYIFVLLGLPGAMVIDATQSRKAELVEFPADLRKKMAADYGYISRDIPAGTYPRIQGGATKVLTTSTSLYGSADASADSIYKVVKNLCENTDRLGSIAKAMATFDCKNAIGDGKVPLHAGAARYYKEKGYLK